MWSKHSRRTLPRYLSQKASALGALYGVRSTSMPLLIATRLNLSPNLLWLSLIKYFGASLCGVLWRCLSHPLGYPHVSKRSRDADMHAPARPKLYDEDDEQWSEEEVVHREEVASPDLLGVVMQERGPVLRGLAL